MAVVGYRVNTRDNLNLINSIRRQCESLAGSVAGRRSRAFDSAQEIIGNIAARIPNARERAANIKKLVNAGDAKALELAISSGNVRLVRLLLGHGAIPKANCFRALNGPHARTIRQQLLQAISYADQVTYRCEIDSTTGIKRTVEKIDTLPVAPNDRIFYHSCLDTAESRDELRAIVASGVSINSATQDGWRAIHHAVRYSTPAHVGFVLGLGADINAQDRDGYTPLQTAINENKPEMVRALLAAGARLDITDKNAWTPLHLAASKGQVEIVEQLLNTEAVRSNPELLNYTDTKGWTPLQVVIHGEGERPAAIRTSLLRAGAGICRGTTDRGITPYRHAAERGAEVRRDLDAAERVRRQARAGWEEGHREMSFQKPRMS